MDLVANVAPVAVSLLVCAIALFSVRRAYRKALPASPPVETRSAAE
jgi:hypothetical protein